MKKTSEAPATPKRFRWLKRVVLGLLALLVVLVILGWVFLPSIAERVIRGMIADAGLEQSELKVVDVGWNEAVIEDVSVSGSNWSLQASSLHVTYDPFDLFDGKVRQILIEELDVELDFTEPESEPGEKEVAGSGQAAVVEEVESESWQQQISKTLANLGSVSAENARIRIKNDTRLYEEEISHLSVSGSGSDAVNFNMLGPSFTLQCDLTNSSGVSELNFASSVSSPDELMNAIELVLGLDGPIIPEGLEVDSAELSGGLAIESSEMKPLGIDGTLAGVRFDGGENPVHTKCDSVAMKLTVNPSGSGKVRFSGSADELNLPIDPAADFELMLKGETSPEFAATIIWGDMPTKIEGSLAALDLVGQYAARPVSLDSTGAKFSWIDGKFAMDGKFSNGGASIPFAYQHTHTDQSDDRWVLDGEVNVGPVQHEKPLPLLNAVTDLFEDVQFEGRSHSKMVFSTGSHQAFQGTLTTELRDAKVDVSQGEILASGVNGVWALNLLPQSDTAPGAEDPSYYTLDFSAKKLSIATEDALDYDLVHEAEKPVRITGKGNFGVDTSTLTGEIKDLSLYGEKNGNEILLADTTVSYRVIGDVVHAKGKTSLAENEIPFNYWHERKTTADTWNLAGWVKIEKADLENPVDNGVMLVEAMEGKTIAGKVGMKMDFTLGSEQDFDAVLSASLADGTLTLEDDGPVLEGLSGDIRISSMKEVKTDAYHRVTAKTVKAFDMEMSNLRLDYRILPNGDVSLKNAAVSALGGVVWVDPFVLPGGDDNYQFKLRMKRLDLGKLAKLFPDFNGSISGEIDGLLPIQNIGGEFMPVRGGMYLTPRSRARLRYDSGNKFSSGINPKTEEYKKMKMVEDSLRNLELKVLSIRMFDPRDGDKAIVLKLRGQAPTVPGSPPIHLNVNGFKPDDDTVDFFDLLLRHRDKLNFGL